ANMPSAVATAFSDIARAVSPLHGVWLPASSAMIGSRIMATMGAGIKFPASARERLLPLFVAIGDCPRSLVVEFRRQRGLRADVPPANRLSLAARQAL